MGYEHLKYTVLVCMATALALPALSEPTAAAGIAQTSARSFQPIPAHTCKQLQSQMSQTLRVKATLTRASFRDSINGGQGMGCQITATGNGRNFQGVADVAGNLRAMLSKQGWVEDKKYLADGPTGTGTGFRKGNSLSLLLVEWEPAASAKCPPDQPISDCPLSPEQQIYRITLNSARP